MGSKTKCGNWEKKILADPSISGISYEAAWQKQKIIAGENDYYTDVRYDI